MPDRFNAQIEIGGKVPKSVLQGLLKALHADEASHEYGDAVIPAACVQIHLYLENGVLRFRNDRAENGEFERTEEFCVKHGIAFDRWSGGYDEFDAENVHFRPGMDVPVVMYADSNGNEIVCGKTVRASMEKLDAFEEAACEADDPGSDDIDWNLLWDGLKLLRDACPKLPPKLENFEIIAIVIPPITIPVVGRMREDGQVELNGNAS